MNFSSSTTLDEVLKHDLSNTDRATIFKLKKDVIADLTVHLLNKLYNKKSLSSTESVDNLVISNLQSLCNKLQEQISLAEQSLLKRAEDLEETIISKVKDVEEKLQHCDRHRDRHRDREFNRNVNLSETEYANVFDPIVSQSENFADESLTGELFDFCENQEYVPENGHSVVMFGEHYKYGKTESPVTPIPQIINSLINKLSTDFPEASQINQVLINKYEGPDSYLPLHSDNEKTISPNSSIFTFSLGSSCKMSFSNLASGDEKEIVVDNNSLYVMSRKSQCSWSHCIKSSPEFVGKRYSVTMRTVGRRFARSTIIQGDSNTRHLKFGEGRGTFGYVMPGETVYAPRLDMLDATKCIGYSNIVIQCGVNDIKLPGSNISLCAEKLISKIGNIKLLCPRSKIIVNPILPTKSSHLNARIVQFNNILFQYLEDVNDPLLQTLNFNVYVDQRSGLLRHDLGRYQSSDQLHLGSAGFRLLAKLVKEKVCGSKVDGRSFAHVVARSDVRSDQRGLRSDSSVSVSGRRLGHVNMMQTPPTTRNHSTVPSRSPAPLP